jgi:hypothetical protein
MKTRWCRAEEKPDEPAPAAEPDAELDDLDPALAAIVQRRIAAERKRMEKAFAASKTTLMAHQKMVRTCTFLQTQKTSRQKVHAVMHHGITQASPVLNSPYVCLGLCNRRRCVNEA